MSEHENLDILGNPVRPGDYVTRPYSLGRSAGLTISKVLKSDLKGLRLANVRPEIDWIRVQMDPENTWNTQTREKFTGWERIKDGTVKYSTRCMLIPRELVPQEIIDLLENNE